MKIIFFILLLFPLSIFASKSNIDNYDIFAKDQANKQQQIISTCSGEIKSLASQADKRTDEIESYISWISDGMKKNEKIKEKQNNSGVDKVQTTETQNKNNTKDEKVLVFVSFSMPETSLEEWLSDAHKFGASVVIRGLKNNSFKETVAAMAKFLEKNKKGGLEINPIVFKEYGINKVPAVVVVNESSRNFDVVYGNITLQYALKLIADKKVK